MVMYLEQWWQKEMKIKKLTWFGRRVLIILKSIINLLVRDQEVIHIQCVYIQYFNNFLLVTFMNKYIILTIFIAICTIWYFCSTNAVYVKSTLDGNDYLVQNGSDKQQVADLLAHLKQNCDILIDHISKKVQQNKYTKFADNITLLETRYHSKKTIFTQNLFNIGTSYTINKGDLIAFCTNNKNTHTPVYDINTMMFVLCHEMAHIGSETYDHTPEFILFFKHLLQTAVELNLYRNVDYSKDPIDYCGISLHHNPLF
jgi:hypothetical protein